MISIVVNIGMWLERYVIVVTSLQPRLPPVLLEQCITGRSGITRPSTARIGLFFSLLFLFIRFLPVISIAEMRELVHETQERTAHPAAEIEEGRPMTNQSTAIEGIYGLMAEFESPEDLVEATRGAYDQGYRMMEAYTPFPVEGLAEALGFHRNRVPRIVLIGGVIGGLARFLHAVVLGGRSHYPLNVGGRPLHSWPAFIPITFELTVLGASLAAVVGMLAMNGLPRPHHPVFNVPGFVLASNDRFFLSIQARDPRFDPATTREFLATFHPKVISVVPH